jgi:mannosyltransferase OCH1-like enzyme
MSMIPKVIHQTWKTSDLPYPFADLADTWKSIHPEWEYKLWTDDMNRDFIKEFYPWFLERFDSYPRNIQRVDAFRYFLLLKEGGIYIDLDFECLENIELLLLDATCVIGKEPAIHCKRFQKDMILCNAFMASTADNDFMRFVCHGLGTERYKADASGKDVLESTGPFMLTEAYLKYNNSSAIKLLEPAQIYPLSMFETRNIFADTLTTEMQQKIDNAFALHYFWGGW